MFADDQVILCNSEWILQTAIYEFHIILVTYNFSVCSRKTEVSATSGKYHKISKTAIHDNVIEQVRDLNSLSFCILCFTDKILKMYQKIQPHVWDYTQNTWT
jgi:hypothetical protein